MKTKIKKVLAMVMCLVVLVGVGAAGVACDTNKETEAEYKARIRKELDEIPVEATGYKLVYSGPEKPYKYFDCSTHGIDATIETDGHYYDFEIHDVGGSDEKSYGFEIAVDNGEKKTMSFNYDDRFKDFGRVFQFAFYDGKVFVVRETERVWGAKPSDYLPPILFIYEYESNTLKYLGYYEEWFNYSVYDEANGRVVITKVVTDEEHEAETMR